MIKIFAVLIVVLGWLVNAYNVRKHEIFKMRLNKRSIYLERIFSVFADLRQAFQDHSLMDQKDVENLYPRFIALEQDVLLYGYKEEIEIYKSMNEIFTKINSDENIKNTDIATEIARKEIIESLDKRISAIRGQIRLEYGFPDS